MRITAFVGKRLLATLPLIFFLPLITLCLMHLVPGNYFDTLRLNPQISADIIKQYEANYHLDQPLLVQYLHWVGNLFKLDLGYSFAYQQPVLDILKLRLWNTFLLSGISLLFAWALAIPFGLWAGLKQGSPADKFLRTIAYFGNSIPNFFLVLLLLYISYRLNLLPLSGMRSVNFDSLGLGSQMLDVARHLIIPVLVLGGGTACYLFRLMRSQTIETARKDWVLFLRACNLPRRKIVFKHIFRNAVNPLITLLGMELPALFSGAALVEIFTGWPGLGQVMLQAVRSQDLFLVLGNMLMVAFLLVIGNLAADLLLAAVDPRIRLGERQ